MNQKPLITISFQGHKNLLGTHEKTFEITTEESLTKKGDCIIGTNAEVNYSEEFKELLKQTKEKNQEIKIKGIIQIENKKDDFQGVLNPKFNLNSKELVFRKSNFISERTILIKCNKSAKELNREIINSLKTENKKAHSYLFLDQ